MFFVTPAEASINTLMESINRVLINPIIYFLFVCATIYFMIGIVKFFLSPGNEEVRKSSKSHMVWGIVGMFIMISVFGIMNLFLRTIGDTKINISNSGSIEIK